VRQPLKLLLGHDKRIIGIFARDFNRSLQAFVLMPIMGSQQVFEEACSEVFHSGLQQNEYQILPRIVGA
jgi:hypothetical protein